MREIGGKKYFMTSLYGVAAGTSDRHDYFHTFQNGMCYELAFEYFQQNPLIVDAGCTTPVITDHDIGAIRQALLRKVSFFHPVD